MYECVEELFGGGLGGEALEEEDHRGFQKPTLGLVSLGLQLVDKM